MKTITEIDILELLELNKDKWLSSKLICKLLGIKETATLRVHINKLRTYGEPIISNNKGYKLADNCLDYVDFLERFEKRNKKNERSIRRYEPSGMDWQKNN